MNFFILLYLLTFISCSSNQKSMNTTSHKGGYLSQEERLRSAALERYRQMRLNEKRPKYRHFKKSPPVRKTIMRKEAPILVNEKELAIEIEQNLSFYCMKNRKRSKLKGTNCDDFVENVHTSCTEKHENIADKRRLYCIKKALRKGP